MSKWIWLPWEAPPRGVCEIALDEPEPEKEWKGPLLLTDGQGDKMTEPNKGETVPFPFHLSDLVCWIVKRNDGITVKYSLKPASALEVKKSKGSSGYHTTAPSSYSGKSLSDWCKHDSPLLPTFEVGGLQLRIADSIGAKAAFSSGIEDLIIDAGDVIQKYQIESCLSGDVSLCNALAQHAGPVKARVLKMHWADRQEPEVHPQFWIDLAKILKKDGDKMLKATGTPFRVLTNCQGGHGRSGTALVCLMMALSDYTPLDAITHLRAVHCSRAIESKIQHAYINTVGALLGRPENALDAEDVKSFKERFLSLKCATSKPYRERLLGTMKAKEKK